MILHVSLDIRGCLRNFKACDWERAVKDDAGKFVTPEQFREYLFDELAKGNKFIPLADDCEGFDPQKGCPGHPHEEAVEVSQ